MPKKLPAQVKNRLEKRANAVEDSLAGAIVRAYQSRLREKTGAPIPIAEIHAALPRLGRDVPSRSDVKDAVKSFLDDHKWLGLVWIESSQSVAPIKGIHWFVHSDMYDRLRVPAFDDLARSFAEVSRFIPNRVANIRLLVDAGSTTFHCLSHPQCELAERAESILTNNLFVAQWLHDPKVTLVEGSWDLHTGAIVDIQMADRRFGGKKIQPTVAIMSWHFVKVLEDDIIFFTQHPKEKDMKHATVKTTKSFVFMVVDEGKFAKTPPVDAPYYSLVNDILPTQHNHANKGHIPQEREIFLVSDFKKMTPELDRALKIFQREQIRENRIWLVGGCPEADTRPKP